MTRDDRVAWLMMLAVSVISTMNVDMPAVMSSCAPIRVKMRSASPTTARSPGTNLPHSPTRTTTAPSHSLLLLQLRSEVALRARQRLLEYVVLRHRNRVRVADLDVVTEHFVEADLQRADPRSAPLRSFQCPDPLTRAARGFRDAVELRVEAGPNRPTLASRRRRVFDQRPRHRRPPLPRVADLSCELPDDQCLAGAENVPERRDGLQGAAQGDELTGVRVTLGGPRGQPLEVPHGLEGGTQGLPDGRRRSELCHSSQAQLDRLGVAHRRSQPGAQPSGATWRSGSLAQLETRRPLTLAHF